MKKKGSLCNLRGVGKTVNKGKGKKRGSRGGLGIVLVPKRRGKSGFGKGESQENWGGTVLIEKSRRENALKP